MSSSNTRTATAGNPDLLPQTRQRRPDARLPESGQGLRRLLMVILAVAATVFHLVLIQGIYVACRPDPHAKQKTQEPIPEEKMVAFKISIPEPVPKPKKPEPDATAHRPEPRPKADRPEPKPSHPPKPTKVEHPPAPQKPKEAEPRPEIGEPKKAPIPQASAQDLQTLGGEHMSLVQEGAFPSLTLSYPDPETYIRQMYHLGAKTLIHQEGSGVLYEIHLLNGRILPIARKDLSGFSVIKRVIHDRHWDPLKERASSRLKTRHEEISLVLVVPQEVETRWVGHQVSVFQNMGVSLEQVQGVDALFQNARLKVVALHLKDGSVRKVNDPGCG